MDRPPCVALVRCFMPQQQPPGGQRVVHIVQEFESVAAVFDCVHHDDGVERLAEPHVFADACDECGRQASQCAVFIVAPVQLHVLVDVRIQQSDRVEGDVVDPQQGPSLGHRPARNLQHVTQRTILEERVVPEFDRFALVLELSLVQGRPEGEFRRLCQTPPLIEKRV